MRLSCCFVYHVAHSSLGCHSERSEESRRHKDGKGIFKNIRFISTSGSRPHPLRVRRQAHSRRHHARPRPPVGTPRILCPFRHGQGRRHRLAQVRHRASEAARLDDVRYAFPDEGWGEGEVI